MGYLESMVFGAGLSCLAWLFGFLAGKYGEATFEGKPEVKRTEEMMPRRAQLENRFELRKGELQAEIARVNVELSGLRRKKFELEKELADTRRDTEAPIRVVGRENSTPIAFRAWIINRQVQAALSEGKTHPTLDMEWATPQIVQIWSDNVADARKEVQRVYPMPLGFSILNVKLDAPEGTQVEASGSDPS